MNSYFVIIFVYFITEISGHGKMLEPLGRSSVWRSYPDKAAINTKDDELFCGGLKIEHEPNDSNCGVCGDAFNESHPQPNENTGTYGKGFIVAQYEPGQVINVSVLLRFNHLGSFTYSLCELKDPKAPEPGEECFEQLLLEDGSAKVPIGPDDYQIHNRLVLPKKTCERCVLRWTYRAGNNMGTCDDGAKALECGAQRFYRSCADIAIRNLN